MSNRISSLWLIVYILGSARVRPSQEINNEYDEFGKDFSDKFHQMDREDRFFNAVDEGFDNWEERCFKTSGQAALDNWLKAQENLVHCALQNFDFIEIQKEMEQKKKTGDLDVLFQNYCGDPVSRTRPCVQKFLEVSNECLKDEDRGSLDVMLSMVDAAIDFLCHGKGERLALFMAENGTQCVKAHQDKMVECINASVPELFRKSRHFNLIVFNHHNCRKGDAISRCIEDELLKCPDPTPANIVESLLTATRRVTPCRRFSKYSLLSRASSSSFFSGFWPIALSLAVIIRL